MIPAMMVVPMGMMMVVHGASVADDARTMHGHHPAATASSDDDGIARISGGIVVIVG